MDKNFVGIVLYDITKAPSRYMSVGDMMMEARLLGLSETDSLRTLAHEVRRRRLDDLSPGRAVKGAQA